MVTGGCLVVMNMSLPGVLLVEGHVGQVGMGDFTMAVLVLMFGGKVLKATSALSVVMGHVVVTVGVEQRLVKVFLPLVLVHRPHSFPANRISPLTDETFT